MKIQYSLTDKNTIIVGKKSSEVEQYDTRINPSEGPVLRSKVSSGDCVIMDFECSNNHDILLAASGTKVFSFQLSTFQLIREYQMPSPMTFQNEGGVSLSLDGKRFFAVSGKSVISGVILTNFNS